MILGLRIAKDFGIGFIGALSLFGCATTPSPNEDLATSPPSAAPDARISQFRSVTNNAQAASRAPAAAEIDPDCPYLRVDVLTPGQGDGAVDRQAWYEIQKPYIEKFSAELERVGFTTREPFWMRLEREGFGDLAAFIECTSEARDRGEEVSSACREAELEEIMEKLTTREAERAGQILEELQLNTWIVYSSVLDIPRPLLKALPRGGGMLVWSWSMEKRPSVLDGALRIDLFTDPTNDNPHRRFGSITGHQLMLKSSFENEAAGAADRASAVFLPHVKQLCSDINATLLNEEAELEEIRNQLTEEIMRVRKRRAEEEKQLKLEVEQ